MESTEAARRSAGAMVGLPAGFMMDGATYARGADLGFDGVDFYVAGRGGALGDVSGAVVAAAFVFFNPAMVGEAWERSAKVAGRLEAARAFAGCLASWADTHLADGVDYKRLADLAGRAIRASSPAGLVLFAAWAGFDEPEAPKALALHRLNVLREMRGGLHAAAVLAAGLEPRVAVMVHAPQMAPVFGWREPHPDPEPHRGRWEEAEVATDQAVGRVLSALGPDERAEFVDLAVAAQEEAR